ncbi:3D-(3,5/4)-trihydroxycyclohexane-1,2-dione acylhydrolase (decyclizing) [Salinicola sp. JS01]|uniref:3D-(3,5/4)-trihydroxycyclohexane-1,2-dione acylhydrolase (decyclizing) n=1 Tax=Salinicola sp. JS01 TaxID=3050071 RepID=UPI00255C02CF|nr:3D-(3,5/4)-trihydroxycyclohexane-1,2-dione acylhydrolase (decyclizing) [Salinicola sp. JS01]WIX31710.1 3D-(3,5/4)-trihydroxycyclohexane-1,2-dione acylhydrolase (decyclizing) [Salinicola sp. JS01]
MSDSVRLTMAQAVVRYLSVQQVDVDGERLPLFAGCWAIFGHGNVAGLGEALYHARDRLPTYRAHNEQAMAHAAIAYAKTLERRRMMVCTASAGPGSTNMVTACALAHVNRLPVLFLPGDTFATRLPDPVLQQVEDFQDLGVTSNDCFRPVSRFFDRITRPEQLLTALPQALRVLTDPADCGPVTLALPQDVQTMAYDFPERLFTPQVHRLRRQGPDTVELEAALDLVRQARRPLVIAGGGVHYAQAREALATLVERHRLPVGETQAGKGALPWDHPCNMGSIGVTGAAAANALAADADLVIAVGTRLGDFTSGSRALLSSQARLLSLNVAAFDAIKHRAQPLVGDARLSLQALAAELGDWQPETAWTKRSATLRDEWRRCVDHATRDRAGPLPSDAEVIGAVNRAAGERDIVVCAAGGLPGELHKLWRTRHPRGYHLEYGYSCMGYELAGGVGVKLASPSSEVFVMVGDGAYLMLNSEIATSVALGLKIVAVVLDNRGFGCIHRLQQACGGPGFNNLLADCRDAGDGAPKVDFAAHAAALGARSETVTGIAELEAALARAKASTTSYVIALDTDPLATTEAGGAWWDVAVAEVSEREAVGAARRRYENHKTRQWQNR